MLNMSDMAYHTLFFKTITSSKQMEKQNWRRKITKYFFLHPGCNSPKSKANAISKIEPGNPLLIISFLGNFSLLSHALTPEL